MCVGGWAFLDELAEGAALGDEGCAAGGVDRALLLVLLAPTWAEAAGAVVVLEALGGA